MKNKKILFSSLATAAVACGVGAYLKNHKENKNPSLPKNFTVTAHTGSMNTKKNSLEAIRVGSAYADIIEFDVNFNKDNVAVLSHNAPRGNEVTLDEAFELVSSIENVKVNVDIKSISNLSSVEELAKKHGVLDRIFLTGIEEKWVDAVKKNCPNVSFYLNFNIDLLKKHNKKYISFVTEKVKQCGAVGINIEKTGAGKELVKQMHEHALLVSVWTVDSKASIKNILAISPDNITTNRPDRIKK